MARLRHGCLGFEVKQVAGLPHRDKVSAYRNAVFAGRQYLQLTVA